MKTLIPVAYVMNLSLSRLVFDNLFTVFTDLKINNFEKKKKLSLPCASCFCHLFDGVSLILVANCFKHFVLSGSTCCGRVLSDKTVFCIKFALFQDPIAPPRLR